MYKTNKYNGKKYKKKRVYSSIKDPFIVSDRLLAKKSYTGIDIFMELFSMNDFTWMIFFRDILKGKYHSPFSLENRLENLMYLIKDDGLQKNIYTQLMDIDDYNPLKDEIPIDKLTPNIQSYIRKLQNLILQNEKSLLENTFYLTHDNVDIKSGVILNPLFKKIAFKLNYGVILFLNEDSLTISTSFNYKTDKKTMKILLNKFHKTIKQIFPGVSLINNNTIEISLTDKEIAVDKVNTLLSLLQDNLSFIYKV